MVLKVDEANFVLCQTIQIGRFDFAAVATDL